MKIIKKKISDIELADYNPRRKNPQMKEALKQSMERRWVVLPLIYNKRTDTIVWWNQRLTLMRELWYTDVDLVELDLDEDEEKELNVTLNNIDFWFDPKKFASLIIDLENRKKLINPISMWLQKSDIDRMRWKMILEWTKPEIETAREILEHHDYVLFIFSNRIDFQNACDRLQLPKVKEFENSTSKKIWVWRALEWDLLLELIEWSSQ